PSTVLVWVDAGAWQLPSVMISFFFFQAEDGIRDRNVTGVQTCALPISAPTRTRVESARQGFLLFATPCELFGSRYRSHFFSRPKIGRASCRERVEISEGAVRLKETGGGENVVQVLQGQTGEATWIEHRR